MILELQYGRRHIIFDEEYVPRTSAFISTPSEAPACVQPSFRWSLVNTWLTECMDHHNKCHQKYFDRPDAIHLIDGQQRKLARADVSWNFVALSYVWGANPNADRLICTNDNVKHLKQVGALKAETLPPSIADAIQICKNIGGNYLWVDRLCIIQNDTSHKYGQIDAMANIFSLAHLVIVVLEGDMETGIPGIQLRPSRIQKQVETAGLVYNHLTKVLA